MPLLEDIDSLISKVENWETPKQKTSTSKLVKYAKKQTEEEEVQGADDIDKKLNYITRGLAEIMNPEKAMKEMRSILEKRPLKIYWGTATTGAPHVAYFIPLTKLGDFLKAGCEVTILLADVHAFLDAEKTPWELLDHRVKYYKAVISSMLRAVNVPLDKLKFVRGREFQLTQEYTLDVYKLCAKTSFGQAKKAGAEVVKQDENPSLAPVLYPLLQALDEEYLKVDVQFGGVDQRKIFAYASDYLNKVLGYKSRIHLMNGICPSLTATAGADGLDKMSSSGSKIDPCETPASVKKKINKAFCEPGNVETNGVLSFCKFVVFPCFLDGKSWTVPVKGGETLTFNTFDECRDAFAREAMHPADLKAATIKILNSVLDKVRADFASPEMQALRKNAYPTKEDKAAEVTPEKQWILDFHKENGQLPTVKEVRKGLGIAKRPAKRALDEVAKTMK